MAKVKEIQSYASFTEWAEKQQTTKMQLYAHLWNFADLYSNTQKHIQTKEPYDINLLSIATKQNHFFLKETSHSIILSSLLKYQENNSYLLLQSFFSLLGIEESIKNPEIEHEKRNIDISILDEDYAIIIENKINDAPDQDSQIQRYITCLKKEKQYAEDNIYVIYLKGKQAKHPSDEGICASFPRKKRIRYEDAGHYFSITFKKEIIHLLSNADVLGNITNLSVKSAWIQYRDYLTQKYRDTSMDKKMKQFLLTKLVERKGIDKDDTDKLVEAINEDINDMERMIGALMDLREEEIQSLFDNTVAPCDSNKNPTDNSIWKELIYQRKRFYISAFFCIDEEETPYISFTYDYNKAHKATATLLKDLLKDGWEHEDNGGIYCWKDTSYKEIIKDYQHYKELIEQALEDKIL